MKHNRDVFEKSFAILTSLHIHPLKWQKEIRDEWYKREITLKGLQVKTMHKTENNELNNK